MRRRDMNYEFLSTGGGKIVVFSTRDEPYPEPNIEK